METSAKIKIYHGLLIATYIVMAIIAVYAAWLVIPDMSSSNNGERGWGVVIAVIVGLPALLVTVVFSRLFRWLYKRSINKSQLATTEQAMPNAVIGTAKTSQSLNDEQNYNK